MVMKVSHEVPRCLLLASQEFNDYDYCLPHLLDKDEEYKQYFFDAKNPEDILLWIIRFMN